MLSVTVKWVVPLPSSEQLLAGPMRDFFNRVMILAHAEVAQPGRVPIDTGRLRQSLAPGGGTTMIDPGAMPKWAKVGTNVAVYPGALEASPRFHYAAGPSAGKPTQGWLSQTVQNVRPDVEGALGQLARDIESTAERR